ncbi:hypothetical protein BDQ17DRAFT_1434431 [Cyathus striatus]|nr:hypothetical protein BDQ17DRAFT_1434431 [Cyathus striatus]
MIQTCAANIFLSWFRIFTLTELAGKEPSPNPASPHNTMQAIQMNETGGPEVLKLATIDKPTLTADDHILVKNIYASLNFIDTVVQRGKIPQKLPLVPGMEGGGGNVLVHVGAGGMGQLLSKISSYRGANVVATVSTASKAELSKANGAKVAVRYSDDAGNAKDLVQDALAASTDGEGFEVVYDSVGKATWDRDKEVLKPRGHLVLYGDASGSPDPVSPGWFAGKSLIFTRPVLFDYITPGEFQSRARASLSGSR